MGSYIDARNKTEALKKARRIIKNNVVVRADPTKNSGQFYVTTRKRKR